MIIAIGIYLVFGVAFYLFIVGKGKRRNNIKISLLMSIMWPRYVVRIVKILYSNRRK